mgnify:CR=1 FL=1
MNSILYNCKNIHKSYRQPVKDLEVIKESKETVPIFLDYQNTNEGCVVFYSERYQIRPQPDTYPRG